MYDPLSLCIESQNPDTDRVVQIKRESELRITLEQLYILI